MGFFIDNSAAAPIFPGAAPVGSSFLGISTNGLDWTAIDKLSVQRVDPVFIADVRYRWQPDREIVGGANEVNPATNEITSSITLNLAGSGTAGVYNGVQTTTNFGGKPIRLQVSVDAGGNVQATKMEYSAGGGYKIGDKLVIPAGNLGVGSSQCVMELQQKDLVGPGTPVGNPQATQGGVNEMYKYINSTRIHMVLGNDAKIEFELQDLDPLSPVAGAWATGDQAGLNAAILELTDWISDI